MPAFAELKEVRCVVCGRLLFKMYGYALIEIRCPRCKSLNKTAITIELDDEEKKESHNE